MSYGTREGGARMTFDGMPLRDGEEEKIFEGHSLNWWRQFSVSEHKKNGTEPWNKAGLTHMLMDDFENHTGFPEKLPKGTMDPEGAQLLATTIVKQTVDEIMDYFVIKQNGYRELNGDHVGGEQLKYYENRSKDATRHLLTPYMDALTLGQSEGIIRMIPSMADKSIELYYTQSYSKDINPNTIKRHLKRLKLDYSEDFLEKKLGHPLEDVVEIFGVKNKDKWEERRRLLFKLVDLENARKKGRKDYEEKI